MLLADDVYRIVGCTSVCVWVVIPFILDVRLVDVPVGVTQDFSTFLLRCLQYCYISNERLIFQLISKYIDRNIPLRKRKFGDCKPILHF